MYKFSVNRKILVDIFKVGGKIVKEGEIIPMYNGALFKVKDKKLSIYFISRKFLLNVHNIEVTSLEEGSVEFGFDSSVLGKLLSASTTENVDFEIKEASILVYTDGKYSFNLIDPEDFFSYEVSIDENCKYVFNISYNELVSVLGKLQKFSIIGNINPADNGILIKKDIITAHTDDGGVVFPFQLSEDIYVSVEPELYGILSQLVLEDLKIFVDENKISITTSYENKYQFNFAVRVLLGEYKDYYIARIKEIYFDEESINFTITKGDWDNFYKRMKYFIYDNILIIKNSDTHDNVLMGCKSGNENVKSSEYKEEFNLAVNDKELNNLFSLCDSLTLKFSDKYNDIISIAIKKDDKIVGMGFLKRFK